MLRFLFFPDSVEMILTTTSWAVRVCSTRACVPSDVVKTGVHITLCGVVPARLALGIEADTDA